MTANLQNSLRLFHHLGYFIIRIITTFYCIQSTFVERDVERACFKLVHVCNIHGNPLYFWTFLYVALLHLIDDNWADVNIDLILEAMIVQVFAKPGVATAKH